MINFVCVTPNLSCHINFLEEAKFLRGQGQAGESGVAGLGRPASGDGHPVHDPAMAVIVVQREMLRATIIPDDEIVRLPAVLVYELRLRGMTEEEAQNSLALIGIHPHDPGRKTRVHIE